MVFRELRNCGEWEVEFIIFIMQRLQMIRRPNLLMLFHVSFYSFSLNTHYIYMNDLNLIEFDIYKMVKKNKIKKINT